ncbi:MAG TPA: HAMP domain-containing sensor histidine kinase [Isosphaeraceae bacterium]|nr:HAMP domain-containing sensor histidine kinase [Isosphaeraceae bacterium]
MSGASRDQLDDAERLKELGHLSAAVGHHVINAFSAVVSNAELIRSQAKDPACDVNELAALGAAIIENALQASQIPRRLIDWTRRVTAPGFDQPGDLPGLIDLNRLIRETVEQQRGATASQVEWVLDLNPIPRIRGNGSQLRSLLGYLIDNAREAMPKGVGTLTFRTHVDSRGWVILEIRDSGCGMSPEVLKRATEPFFSTKPGRSGTGLTIAHGIWRRHRGALSIESQPAQGTAIRLAVEAASTPSPPPAPAETQTQTAPVPSPSAPSPTSESPDSAHRPG